MRTTSVMNDSKVFKASIYFVGALCVACMVGAYLLLSEVVALLSVSGKLCLLLIISSFFGSAFLYIATHLRQKKKIYTLTEELESLIDRRNKFGQMADEDMPLAILLQCVRERVIAGEDAAAQAVMLQSRFRRTVTEDIKSPLLEMMAGIKSLREVKQTPSELAIIESLHAAAFRLLGSLDDVLEIGKEQKGELESREIGAAHFNPRQLADDLSEIYAAPVSKKEGVVLSVLVDPRSPVKFQAAPKRIMHMLGNLVENALRYTEKGEICLEMSCLNEERSGSTCRYQFICSDSGIGIAAARLERLNYELSHAIPENEFEELGLGLRAVLKIVQEMRGSIKINSLKGEQTQVIINLTLRVSEWGETDQKQLPSFFIHSSSREVFMTLAKIAFFHKVRPILIDDVSTYSGSLPLIIDAKALLKDDNSAIAEIKNKERCITLLSHDQLKWRTRLAQMGFERFLVLPLTSTSLLRVLLDKDIEEGGKRNNAQDLNLESLRVLVVDDVPTARIAITDFLSSHGATVVEANDGIELLHLTAAREAGFDLILCDLNMGKVDGLEAVKRLRTISESASRQAKIVAVTAYDVKEEAWVRAHPEFDATLNKPIDFRVLQSLLVKFFGDKLTMTTPSEKSPTTSVATKFIDLDDLLARAAGKPKIAAKVLESFIVSAQSELQDLLREKTSGDSVLLTKSLHTLKGLLLEVGAKEPAERMQSYEDQLKADASALDRSWHEISGILAKACEEAGTLKESLTSDSRKEAFMVRDSLPVYRPPR